MDMDRNFPFLCSVDTKKYTISESKNQMQSASNIEFRGSCQKPTVEMSFNHLFGLQTLITNVEILCSSHHSFDTNFENVQIQISSLTNRGHYSQLINPKLQKEGNLLTFSGLGLTHCVRISFALRSESKRKNMRQTQKQLHQYYQKAFNECIKQINLYGIAINSNPSSILLTKLLNISQSFKRYNFLQQATEANILVALSLISARRFVLAAQILRKVSKFYVDKYTNSKSIMDLNRTERSLVREYDDDIGQTTNRSNFGSGRILQGNKFLQRAAKIELLLAETISHPSLVLEKLQSYHRCDSYASGNVNPTPLRPDADLEEVALTIFPQIIQFLLKQLSDKLEPFRIAALKSIQFFIQTLGCSIGASFMLILKQVIITYPNSVSSEINSNRIPYGLQQVDIIQEKSSEFASGSPVLKNKMLIDHYHHLLETLLSLMSLANRKMVISLFGEIIIPSILSKNQSYELKLYLLRFSQKAISISGADLNIQMSFIGLLLSFCEQKNVSKNSFHNELQKSMGKNQNLGKRQDGSGPGQNKHILHNMIYFSQKILSILKLKVLPRYSQTKMSSFLDWVNKTLTYLGQNQILSNTNSNHSLFVFTTILDFIISIYSVLKYDSVRLVNSPIETVLYFANLSIYNQQTGLPFDKILQALVALLKYHNLMDSNFELDVEIVSRVLEKSKEHNLSLKQLQILIKIIQILKEDDAIILQWLEIYLGCIPHSTYDETYKVFCLLLQKGMKHIHNYPKKTELLKRIVKTMLDQYTVKGKAHQQAKETLIQTLIKTKPSNVLDLIEVCLFNNQEPKPEAYYSKRKAKMFEKIKKDFEHRFDSKAYKIDYEMFVEKISMTQLILSTIQLKKQVCLALVQQSFLEKFFACMKNMIETPSMKIKGKALSLINHFLINTVHMWKDDRFQIKPFYLITRHIFNLSKSLAFKLKQSKLMYNSLYNIINLFRYYEIQTEATENQKILQYQIQKTFEETEEWIKIQNTQKNEQISKSKGQRIIHLVLVTQFLKLWPNLVQVLNSSWEHVRQIYFLLIIEVFRQGLCSLPHILKKKALEILKPLLSNLFKSTEHSEREAALKIFGCLLGLRGSIQNRDNRLGQVVSENLKYLKCYVEKIHELTFDWHQKNVQIAGSLCEICLSQDSNAILNERRKQLLSRKGSNLENSYLSFNLEEQINFQRKNFISLVSNSSDNQLFRQSWLIDEQSLPLEEAYCPNITEELLYKIVQFKNMIQKQIQAKTQVFGEKESFLEQNEQQFYDMGEERAESIEGKQKSEDDQLQFEDLGIIELDDEQWGEQEQKSEKQLQKLPLKKNYKLSPNVFNASKPQRIRSKRFHQNQFDYREKIVVDELQQKIKNSNQQTQPIVNLPNVHKNNQYSIDSEQANQGQGYSKLQNIQKQEKIEKKEHKKPNFMEPLIVQDFGFKEEQAGQEIDSNLDRRPNRERCEKEVKKQKQKQEQTQTKQKEGEKKIKKTSSKKRKASLGK